MTNILHGAVGADVVGLLLPGPIRDQIFEAAAHAAPDETCGLLIGRIDGGRAMVTTLAESRNLAPDPRTGFEIDAELLFDTQRTLRGTGEHVLGHYHSHPEGRAQPSSADRQRAWVPGHIWLIAVPPVVMRQARLSAHLAVEEKGRVVLRPLEITGV